MKWINVYSTTRHYGGPEEGGWWYNWEECIVSTAFHADTPIDVLESEKARLSLLFRGHDEGNIYSVNGGVEHWVAIEDERAESETKERPYYE